MNSLNIGSEKTHSQEWCPVLPCKLGRQHHALSTTCTKPTGHNDARGTAQLLPGLVVLVLIGGLDSILKVLGINPHQIQLPPQVHGRVLERLDYRQVGIMRLHVLANQSDADRGLLLLSDHMLPVLPELSALGHSGRQDGQNTEVQSDTQQRDELLLLQEDRDLVDGWHVADDENLVDLHGAVERELGDGGICKRCLAPTGDLAIWSTRILVIQRQTFYIPGRGSSRSYGLT